MTRLRLIIVEMLIVVSIISAGDAVAGASHALDAALVSGNWTAIEAAAAGLLWSNGFEAEQAVLLGYGALARDDSAGAVRHFVLGSSTSTRWGTARAEALARSNPGHAFLRFLAGDAAARRGDMKDALVHLDAALVRDPGLTIARLARAIVRAVDGSRAQALDDLSAIGGQRSLMAEVLVARGILRLEAGHADEALADLNRAVDLVPTHAIAYNTRGVAHARRGAWQNASSDFEHAFQLLPELSEARHNWKVAGLAAAHGATLSAKGDISRLTLVVADPETMKTATATASELVRSRTGQTPIVVSNVAEALGLALSQSVVLQVPNTGLRATAGERVLATLKSIDKSLAGRPANIDVVTQGFDAADNAAMGILRYQRVPQPTQARVASLHMVDYSEATGLVGKTPMAITDLTALAGRGAELQKRGLDVIGYPTEGKPGLQHMRNIKDFQVAGIPTFSVQWKGKGETSIGLPLSIGIGIQNGADSAGTRVDLGTRDWIFRGTGVERHLTGTLGDIMRQDLTALTRSTERGGVVVGPVEAARGAGGRVTFRSGVQGSTQLRLRQTLFGAVRPGSSVVLPAAPTVSPEVVR